MAIADENPAFDIREMTKKLIGDVLRTVEITAQEAAWYLLREPMCKTCTKIVYIPTVWPNERQTSSKKNSDEMEEVICDENPSEMIKTDMFQKYEERPQAMEHVTLAQFAAKYYWNTKNEYLRREEPSIIRYHNYDPDKEMDEYKREMVTLHLPFRCEQWEILLDNKFVELFDENEEIILQRRKEFEKDLDGKRVIDICEEICDESGETCDFGMRDLINVSWSVKTEPMME
ncbi:uncharacterized protein LOC107043034 [Diachasma alloeum]|uniref:uncharacterized protein LOC107043034 n=1 Tax=Diachasma alloeum TaxID=454923 RepID=UPI0007384E04|nr:uncharacterized protein LOC107043034 [Diachasma alloeum]